ncbi:MAG: sulfite exporter TauE/SafE family protein [Aristaeellaceae bacterium]
MTTIVFFLVSLIASTIGAIAGIGGGVLIKPIMDSFHILPVSTISFLSGCTVLSMALYSVTRAITSGDNYLESQTAVPLGIGAAIGGVLGKELFKRLSGMFAQPDMVGFIQSGCLMLVTLLTFIYTLCTAKISTKQIRNPLLTTAIGLVMGILSAFLGIGGGPINLMVLSYFFSMDIKTSAQNSLMVILLSQIASLATTFITHTVPDFPVPLLCLMILGGILGGAFGRILNKRMSAKYVRLLYLGTMGFIILLSLKNMIAYLN